MFHFLLPALLSQFVVSPPIPRFEAEVVDSTISIGYGIALGDVDGDSKPDILLADKTQIVWYRNGDWKRFVIAENLTRYDNVCIAAKDLDGDGKVEVAVGAQWNPGETTDPSISGSVHYLIAGTDRTKRWKSIELPHEPTVHRMRWIRAGSNHYLLVLPLHGRGNISGQGAGVNVYAYQYPSTVDGKWTRILIDSSMHLTHNFDYRDDDTKNNGIYIAGKEGIQFISTGNEILKPTAANRMLTTFSAGEVKHAYLKNKLVLATIEPMHGNTVAIYEDGQRKILTTELKEGHALALADFTGDGNLHVVAGWRNPDANGKVGVKIFFPDAASSSWNSSWIDDKMACEDLQVMDMNNDGRLDIVASGRASRDLKIYWNRGESREQ